MNEREDAKEQAKKLKHDNHLCEADGCSNEADYEGLAYEVEDDQRYCYYIFVCEKHLDINSEYAYERV